MAVIGIRLVTHDAPIILFDSLTRAVEHPRPASRGRRVSAPSSSNHAGTAAWSTSIRRHTLPSGEPSRHYRAGRCSPTCEATGAQAVSPGSGPHAARHAGEEDATTSGTLVLSVVGL